MALVHLHGIMAFYGDCPSSRLILRTMQILLLGTQFCFQNF